MNPQNSGEWQGARKAGRPRVDKHLRRIHPMRTRFSQDDTDWIGQALAILDESYSSWSRRTLVESAKRTVLREQKKSK